MLSDKRLTSFYFTDAMVNVLFRSRVMVRLRVRVGLYKMSSSVFANSLYEVCYSWSDSLGVGTPLTAQL